MANDLDVAALVDSVLLELAAKHMLGEPDQAITAADCARLAKGRDRRGKILRLRLSDAQRVLTEMVRLGWPIASVDGRRFMLVRANG